VNHAHACRDVLCSEALALELARRPELRRDDCERMRAGRASSPLFETVGYTRALEALLVAAWEGVTTAQAVGG
jgi:predicted O-linked N-acetylglucosamine transferase (SPINDLY family)